MRLIYVANFRLPTEKAHGIQTVKMCEAFSRFEITNYKKQITNKSQIQNSKLEVELVAPRRLNKIKQNIFEYYDIRPRIAMDTEPRMTTDKNQRQSALFKITKLPCVDLIPLSGFLKGSVLWLETFTFLILVKIYLLFKKYDILYTREQFAGLFFKDFVLELHKLPTKTKKFHIKIWQRARKLVVLTSFIKEELIKVGIPESKILIAPDGVDLNKFKIEKSKIKIKEDLNLPQDKKIVMYTGHLYDWKGAGVLAEAARKMQETRDKLQTLFVFVGGTDHDIKKFNIQHSIFNILVVGRRPHNEIPMWLKAADVLILPNTAKEKISKYYTSPLKLFEYMASGRPIVASDLPSIREILNKNNSILVKPDDPRDLAEGIKKALQDSGLADRISKQALSDVQDYTWQKRAKKILSYVG